MVVIHENQDDNSFLRRRKASVRRKYKNTRSRTIEEATELAVFLYAVGQERETEELLDSFCELSPFNQYRPQRWMAVGQAILFNAYIKAQNNNYEECERLTNIVHHCDYDPISGVSKTELLNVLIEVKTTEFELLDKLEEFTKRDCCDVYAQEYLFFIYAKQMLPRCLKKISVSDELIIDSAMSEILYLLKCKILNL